MDDPLFVLDANVFIEAAHRYYAFDIAPPFWKSLIYNAKNGRILSIDRVKQELELGKDQLAKWVKVDFAHGFVSTTETDIVESYAKVMIWVEAQNQFLDAAKAKFASGADGWLVAYAKVKGLVKEASP